MSRALPVLRPAGDLESEQVQAHDSALLAGSCCAHGGGTRHTAGKKADKQKPRGRCGVLVCCWMNVLKWVGKAHRRKGFDTVRRAWRGGGDACELVAGSIWAGIL